MEIFNEEKDKNLHSGFLLQKTKNGQKRAVGKEKVRVLNFRERKCSFSQDFREFGPSDCFGPRSKVASHDEGYAWAPVLEVFDKLREVGVLSFLSYTLFKCFVND